MRLRRLLIPAALLLILLSLLPAAQAAKTSVAFDSTASMSLSSSFAFDREEKGITYYKDTKNQVTLGYKVTAGQADLSSIASQLKKSGYTKVKKKTVNGIATVQGYRAASDGRETRMLYFNTRAAQYVMLALTYDSSKSASKKAANAVVSSLKVTGSASTTPPPGPTPTPTPAPRPVDGLPSPVSLDLSVPAPAFAWTGIDGKKISSSTYGGKDLLMIYGTATSNGYTEAFLDLAAPYLSTLSKRKVTVLVGLYNADAAQAKSFAARYPGIVCGLVPMPKDVTTETGGMWHALQACGCGDENINYPVVFLRSRGNRLKYYCTGRYDNALAIVAGAIQMADSGGAAATPQPDPTSGPAKTDDAVDIDGGRYTLSKGTAVLIGPSTDYTTSVVVHATLTADGKTYKCSEVAAGAFKGCTSLEEITFGSEVASIGQEAFLNCKNLKSITFTTRKLSSGKVGKNAFKGINSAAVIKCPSGLAGSYRSWLAAKGVPGTAVIR